MPPPAPPHPPSLPPFAGTFGSCPAQGWSWGLPGHSGRPFPELWGGLCHRAREYQQHVALLGLEAGRNAADLRRVMDSLAARRTPPSTNMPPPPPGHGGFSTAQGATKAHRAPQKCGFAAEVRSPPVPKMARPDFPNCKFRFFPRCSLWSGGGGVQGVNPPPPPLVYGHSDTSLPVAPHAQPPHNCIPCCVALSHAPARSRSSASVSARARDCAS